MRLNAQRTFPIFAVFVLLLSMLFMVPASAAQNQPVRDSGMEYGFLSSLNAQRAAGGLGPLTMNGSMSAAAAGWALQMTSGSFLAHAGDIISGTPGGWSKVGENVGRGQTVNSLTQAFMASPTHRANVMDPSYTHVGIAVYIHPSDGRIYTTHRFAALRGQAAPAPVAAAPTPIPVAPTAIPAPPQQPTAVPVAPTAVPAPPQQPTVVPVAPTAVPAPPQEPTAVPVAPTAVRVPPTAVPQQEFGQPPSRLPLVDLDELIENTIRKHESKMAKTAGSY